MPTVLITGAAGLVGSECVRYYAERGWEVVGVDNDQRSELFGTSKAPRFRHPNYRHIRDDIRNFEDIDLTVECAKPDLVIHTAAQPSHDWSAKEPLTDFAINATGTLNVLEATRRHAPNAVFIQVSTNKVLGSLPFVFLEELPTRWEPDPNWAGFDESFSIDQVMKSPFGASKAAADLVVQEFGLYYGMKTACFRCGCITGPAHAGAKLHGFLAYLVQQCVTGGEYVVEGYKGKQVRDQIHAYDLVTAFDEFHKRPTSGAVYVMGGGRERSVSVLEAIELAERLSGKRLNWRYSEQARRGDHIWYCSDVSAFRRDYPAWAYKYGLEDMVREIIEAKRVAA